MTETLPDYTTAIITVIFLLFLGIVAYIIKIKSSSLKKIIKKQDQLEVLNQLQLRNGYFAYIFKTGEHSFFFVGHKSGRSSLIQINSSTSDKNIEDLTKNNSQFEKRTKPNNNFLKSSVDKKPLQHVNISDLLTAHKKGGSDA